MRKLRTRGRDEGIILPLVLIVSLIIATGLMALATRSWLGLSGTIRQSQAREAREIAEAGLAKTFDSLNSEHAFLLIKNLSNWSNNSQVSSICPDAKKGQPASSGTVGTNGKYSLLEYTFEGSPFYGGKATMKVKGQRVDKNNNVQATAIVEQTVDIKPKCCNTPFKEPCPTSGFPGLMGQTVSLGNADLFGTLSGNVLCLQCYSGSDYENLDRDAQEDAINLKENGFVAGQIFLGPIDLEPVPQPDCTKITCKPPADITSSTTIEAKDGTTPPEYCTLESDPPIGERSILHCFVKNINLNSKNEILTVKTTDSDIRIYVSEDVLMKGGGALQHILGPNSNDASLGLFGRPADENNSFPDQTVVLAGASSTTSLWIYFPDGNIGINGGSGEEASCDPSGDECTGGDIRGAVWGKSWGGSSSDRAQIVVPSDMASQLLMRYGQGYALGVRDYVALGVSNWRSFIQQ